MPGGEFSLFKTFVHLEDGPGASEVVVGDRFWEEIGGRAELQEGRLVTASPGDLCKTDWGPGGGSGGGIHLNLSPLLGSTLSLSPSGGN